MSTQVAIIVGAVIVAAGLFFALSPAQTDAPAVSDADTGGSAPGARRDEGSGSGPALYVPRSNDDGRQMRKELDAARARIAELEKRGTEGADKPVDDPAASAQKRAKVLELVRAYSTGTATREQVGELLRLAKDKALMKQVVTGLQSKIDENPDDLSARLQLAEVESARVHGAESITERAMLAGNVREQLTEVLKRDPENWDARYMRAVGISHSQRTPQGRATAIREFESLVALQEARSAEPKFAETYGQLAEVYVAEKDVEKARAALENGLARYPDSKDLRRRLEALGR